MEERNKKEVVENNKEANIQEAIMPPIEKVGLLEVGSEFIKPDVEEGDVEKEISQYPESLETKKALIEAVKRADKIVKPTDGGATSKPGKQEERKGMKEELQSEINPKIPKNTKKEKFSNKDNDKVQEI